jgi:hypothetical protein
MGADKKLEKLVQDAAYQKAAAKTEALILVYEDKTQILFGSPKKPKKNSDIRKI